uniref:Selenoprotein P N-terminal domain-containing protein n=1 Tax=Cyclopterus lumpus TaxID=8103 RepID=A0A8C2ZPW8_CYCLU
MVVNQQREQAQRLHAMLAQRLSVNITLYNQSDQQPDVWQALSGEKDDFLVYDRCGRLTHQISLPYSIIGQGHVEGAIKEAYCSRTCGQCAHEVQATHNCENIHSDTPLAAEEDAGRGRHHQHHQHHHGHGHHGDNHGVHPHGRHHGQDHDGAGQQGVRHQGHERDGRIAHMQHNYELGQMQEAVYIHQMQQDAPRANMRP